MKRNHCNQRFSQQVKIEKAAQCICGIFFSTKLKARKCGALYAVNLSVKWKWKTKFASLIKLTALSFQEKYSWNDLFLPGETELEESNTTEAGLRHEQSQKTVISAHVPFPSSMGLRRETGKMPTRSLSCSPNIQTLNRYTKNRYASDCKMLLQMLTFKGWEETLMNPPYRKMEESKPQEKTIWQ